MPCLSCPEDRRLDAPLVVGPLLGAKLRVVREEALLQDIVPRGDGLATDAGGLAQRGAIGDPGGSGEEEGAATEPGGGGEGAGGTDGAHDRGRSANGAGARAGNGARERNNRASPGATRNLGHPAPESPDHNLVVARCEGLSYLLRHRQKARAMGTIRIKDVTVFPRLGVGELEKEWVQKVTLDVELTLDLSAAGRSDAITDTVDYQQVYELIREVSEERRYHLIEALARRLAAAIRERFAVDRVLVRVRKLSLPFDAHLSCIEVELTEPEG